MEKNMKPGSEFWHSMDYHAQSAMPKSTTGKPKIALMSYAMDNRAAKGSALYTRKLIEGMLPSNEFDFYLVHYDKVSDPL
ncbi:MAG TPA: hypothetical protein VJG67_03280, partial [Candidatus Paceibacterota bacterium]